MPCLCESIPWSSVSQSIPWIIAVFGWYIVNKQNNLREQRKETRASLDRFIVRLETLERNAIDFHTSEYDETKSKQIVVEIQRLSMIALHTNLLSITRHIELFSNLRKAITLNNFDKSTHQLLDITSKTIENISYEATEIIEKLENGFSGKYQ
jgi:hypothetical protein